MMSGDAVATGNAATLGAPEGGVLGGPSIAGFLQGVLEARPTTRVWLAASLRAEWEGAIQASGAVCQLLTLEGRDALNTLMDTA